MERREIGRSGLRVAPLALGGNVFGWTADEATSFAVLDAFVDGGFQLVDTADVYSRWAPGHAGGESESVIGRWLKAPGNAHKRDRIVLATKVGKPMGDEGSGKAGLSRRWIRQAVHDSLTRLQTDRIDLYQSHDDDPATPLEETMAAFGELIAEGKVRAIGASNFTAARLAEANAVAARLGVPRYECLQPHYNLVERKVYEDELGATPAQVALAWQMARPGITAPIASATGVAQLQELLGAARLRLSPAQVARLDGASAGL